MNDIHCTILNQFAVVPASCDRQVSPAGGGFSGAGVWRVSTPRENYALRQWPANSLPEARLNELHRLLKHLAASGLDYVAVPCPSVHGATLVWSKNHMWQLEPWLPGAADFHHQPTTTRLFNAMRALARWHLAAARFVPTAPGTQWFATVASARSPAVRERLERAVPWLQTDLGRIHRLLTGSSQQTDFDHVASQIAVLARLALPNVQQELNELADVPVPIQPCLRDIWHDHVLFEENEVSGIIDPSACRSENVATDLARLLGSLVADDRHLWQQALECYSQCRPLSANELRLVRALDRSAVVLSPLTWLNRKYLQQRSFDEAAVLPRLRQQLQRLTTLTQSLRLS